MAAVSTWTGRPVSDVKARARIMLDRSRAHETTRLRAPGMVDALLAACPAGRVRIRDDMPVLYTGPEFLPRRAAL